MQINKPLVIGMIHLPATLSFKSWPGIAKFIQKAKKDLMALERGGADAALIENDGDSPCQVEGTPDVVAPMVVVAHELSKIAKIPLGVEVLLNDPKASLVIAKTCDLQFIRTDYFVDRMTRQGYGEFKIDHKGLMEYRKRINAENVKIFVDIQVKYATMIDSKKTISMSAREAIKYGADGLIVSGTMTGVRPIYKDLKDAKKTARGRIPVIIGSGFSQDNALDLLENADWAIVGSSIKTNGVVDDRKVKKLMSRVRSI